MLGHHCEPVRADRENPLLSMELLMNPMGTLPCSRCGVRVKARAQIVYEHGVDYIEIRQVE